MPFFICDRGKAAAGVCRAEWSGWLSVIAVSASAGMYVTVNVFPGSRQRHIIINNSSIGIYAVSIKICRPVFPDKPSKPLFVADAVGLCKSINPFEAGVQVSPAMRLIFGRTFHRAFHLWLSWFKKTKAYRSPRGQRGVGYRTFLFAREKTCEVYKIKAAQIFTKNISTHLLLAVNGFRLAL